MMTKWPRSRGSHTTFGGHSGTHRTGGFYPQFDPIPRTPQLDPIPRSSYETPHPKCQRFFPPVNHGVWRVWNVIWTWEQNGTNYSTVSSRVIQGSFVGVQPCRWGSNSRAKCRAVFQQTTGFHRVWGEAPYQHGRYGGCCKLFNTCKWHPDLWAGIHESQTIPSMAISKYLKNSIPFQAQSLSSFHAKGLDNWTVGKNPVAMAATEFVDYYDLPRP